MLGRVDSEEEVGHRRKDDRDARGKTVDGHAERDRKVRHKEEPRKIEPESRSAFMVRFFGEAVNYLPLGDCVRALLQVCTLWRDSLTPRVLLQHYPLYPDTMATAWRLVKYGNKLTSVVIWLPVTSVRPKLNEVLFFVDLFPYAELAILPKLRQVSLAGKVYATNKEKLSKVKKDDGMTSLLQWSLLGSAVSFDLELKSLSKSMSRVVESLDLQFTIRPQDKEFRPTVVEVTPNLLYLEHLRLSSTDVLKVEAKLRSFFLLDSSNSL